MSLLEGQYLFDLSSGKGWQMAYIIPIGTTHRGFRKNLKSKNMLTHTGVGDQQMAPTSKGHF